MAEGSDQGTGKHPHKSTEEPYSHTKGSESGERRESRGESSGSERQESASGTSQGGPTSDTRDLKEREYRDEEGNVHHHTHTAEAMKDKKAA